jgi:hypothetical protein
MRSGALYITGLKCTFHIKRLDSLFAAFNKARQCTVTTAPRQYIIASADSFSPAVGRYAPL